MKRYRMAIAAFVAVISHVVVLNATAQPAKADKTTEKHAATTVEASDANALLAQGCCHASSSSKTVMHGGQYKCSYNKTDALQCMKTTPTSKEGSGAEVKWRVVFPCPFGCIEGESKGAKSHCAKVEKRK